MLARQDRPHRDASADVRISGRLDDDVDGELGKDFRVLGGDGLAASDGIRRGRDGELVTTTSSRRCPQSSNARTTRSVLMSAMMALRMPFMRPIWQIAPVPMRPAPTKPTWIGLPCAARRSNACLNISLPLSLF